MKQNVVSGRADPRHAGIDPSESLASLLRPNGEPVPQHWTQFQIGECVVIKNYTFRVAYIGETAILFEPVGIPDLGARLGP